MSNILYRNIIRRFSSNLTGPLPKSTKITNADDPLMQQYNKPMQILHWLQGIVISGCIISGYLAHRIDHKTATKEEKGMKTNLMFYHESFGVLMFGLIIPRLGFRLFSKQPKELPSNLFFEKMHSLSNFFLYTVAIIGLPVSGVAMGYYSGYNVPFFNWKLPSASKENQNKELSGWLFKQHSQFGQLLEYVIPLHIGGAFFHQFVLGHNTFRRISPFASKVITESANKNPWKV